ncbi:MAG: methyltransferase domain-containing protein [candidate division NC10 bacterium]|nr:methyltransferase domain-containing protein [candidate division NC10 bacterium]
MVAESDRRRRTGYILTSAAKERSDEPDRRRHSEDGGAAPVSGAGPGGRRGGGADGRRRGSLLRSEEPRHVLRRAPAVAGCGNTIELGQPRPGEVVVDLGSGGGIDAFLGGRSVGTEGRVIGIDMTPEMIALARGNARQVETGNVEFRLGELEHLPVGDGSADLVVSNCVINLAPDKAVVFREAYRVLRPGGRLAVSDIILTDELPEAERRNAELWAGCVAGALPELDYLEAIRQAGFAAVEVAARSPSARPGVASIKVRAAKPA